MKAYQRILLLTLFSILLCCIVTACHTVDAEIPEKAESIAAPEQPPDDPLPEAVETKVILSPYVPADPGTKDLVYNDHLEFYIQEYETEQSLGGFSTAASLMCRELDTGNEWALDDLGYGSDHSYWSRVQLYPFTGILGYDGFVFEHPLGAGYEVYDFYKVSDSGALCIATCYNTMYTADLDGDGQLELLSNYHNMGYLDLFWGDEDHGSARSCSLNETARDFFDLRPGRDWVGLYVQEETGIATAGWNTDSGTRQSEAVDIAALWEWEKNRTEFWDAVTLHTADGRAPLVLLRETRVSPSWNDYYQVEEIQIYEDDTLLQTISAAALSYDGDQLFDGLYVLRGGYSLGDPVVQDFNFDGCDDLGLLAVDYFPHNVSYCYFLWDEEAGRLSTDFFVLFAWLDLDEENQQIIEQVSNGNDGYAYNYYQFDSSNRPVLVKKEVFTYQTSPAELWRTTYTLIDGEMVETSHEFLEELH